MDPTPDAEEDERLADLTALAMAYGGSDALADERDDEFFKDR